MHRELTALQKLSSPCRALESETVEFVSEIGSMIATINMSSERERGRKREREGGREGGRGGRVLIQGA